VVRPKCAAPTFEWGFTYIGLLITVVIMGLMLTVVARVWTTTEQRERETQLLFVGHAYRMAIASYFAFGHRYPPTLESLLKDERFPVPKRHLRRLYPDPMTGQADWTLIMTPSGQAIMGVASSSQSPPIKRDGFDSIDNAFKGVACYCLWRFIYYPNRWNRAWGTVPVIPPGVSTLPDPTSPATPDPTIPGLYTPGTSPASPPPNR
jgi:type II secretory pathway pseudopilin PulG